jgi:hypothetical protein
VKAEERRGGNVPVKIQNLWRIDFLYHREQASMRGTHEISRQRFRYREAVHHNFPDRATLRECVFNSA